MPPFDRAPDGVFVTVQVQPRASRPGVVGRHGDAVRIRITSAPVENKANEELIRLVAGLLDVPRRAVTIERGQTGRRKVIRIQGRTPAEAAAQLEVGEGGPDPL